jgi:hypothetical protein
MRPAGWMIQISPGTTRRQPPTNFPALQAAGCAQTTPGGGSRPGLGPVAGRPAERGPQTTTDPLPPRPGPGATTRRCRQPVGRLGNHRLGPAGGPERPARTGPESPCSVRRGRGPTTRPGHPPAAASTTGSPGLELCATIAWPRRSIANKDGPYSWSTKISDELSTKLRALYPASSRRTTSKFGDSVYARVA